MKYLVQTSISTSKALFRLQSAAEWIVRSMIATGEKGSAHHYSLLSFYRKNRWYYPYPETTGYIIPTLLKFSKLSGNSVFKDISFRMANWLLSLQGSDGSFPGGYYRGAIRSPSIFNTAQILKGLIAVYRSNGEKRYYDGASAAVYWIVKNQEADGSWKKYGYYNNFSPSYYTEVCWPLLSFWEITHEPEFKEAALKGLHYIAKRQRKDGSISESGFQPIGRAFSHTIGYTINGMLESALILKEDGKEIWECGIRAAELLLKIQESEERIAGEYTEEWKPVYWFQCLTGNCQIAIAWNLIYHRNGELRYILNARKLLDVVIQCQYMPKQDHENKGGIPGSKPIWGNYMRFKYPSWAAKYFMDAVMDLYFTNQSHIKTTRLSGQ